MIGGIGSLVAALQNPEHKALVRANTAAIQKLKDEIGNLDLNVSGDDFDKAKKFLNGMKQSDWELATRDPQAFIAKMRKETGLSAEDFGRIAKELGINMYNKEGYFVPTRLYEMMQAMNNTEFGTVGEDFTSRLQYFRDTQSVQGVTGLAQIGGLGNWLRSATGGNVSAFGGIDFSDPTSAYNKLFALFGRLGAGGVSAAEMGNLTGSQFRDLLVEMMNGLRDAGASTGNTSGGSTGTGTTGTGTTDGTGTTTGSGSINIPGIGTVSGTTAEMVGAAIKAQTDALVPLLTDSMTLYARTADATEGTYQTLLRIEEQIAGLDVGSVLDRAMATRANAADLAVGILPVNR